MKYVVSVNGERVIVSTDASGVSVDGESVSADLVEIAGSPLVALSIGNALHSIHLKRVSRVRYSMSLAGHRYEVEALDERAQAIRDLDIQRNVHSGPAPLTAPMPGLIVRVLVQEGDTVEQNQALVVIEAMKMENELRAATTGRVRRVHVEPGTAVEKGTLLVELESLDA